MRAAQQLSPGEWAVLALVAERPTHGFAVAKELSPEGQIGRVWTFPRPLVYRALEALRAQGLVEEQGVETGDRGPNRTIMRVTRRGRERVRRWLAEPVEHVRDARSLLMLKLLFLERAGAETSPLLAAQRAQFEPLAAALETRAAAADGFERMLVLWRLESTRAVLRFVATLNDDR